MAVDEFRIGVRRRLYNWALRQARLDAGLSVKELCEKACIHIGDYYDYQRFARYPSPDRGFRLSVVLGVSVEVLFPSEIAPVRIRKQMEDMTISLAEFASLAEINAASVLETSGWEAEVEARELLPSVVTSVLATLTDRERKVLELRFGMGENDAHTLEECGEVFGVGRERIRQVEAKALRKLRHHTRSHRLKDWCR